MVRVVCLRYVLCCGIHAIVFALMCFLILSLVLVLAGLLSFGNFCTLGVGAFGIGLLIVAAWIGSVHARWVGSITFGLGVVSLNSVSRGGLVVLSKVTPHCSEAACSLCAGAVSRMLLSML